MTNQRQNNTDSEPSAEGDDLLASLRASLIAAADRDLPPQNLMIEASSIKAVECRPELLSRIVDQVFQTQSSDRDSFYESLGRLNHILPFGSEGRTILGLVWQAALLRLPEDERESKLEEFPRNEDGAFFGLLEALPIVLRKIRLSPARALPWFRRIRVVLGEDLCNRGYWCGIDAWTETDPVNARDVLDKISEHFPDDDTLSLGARILATLRRQGADCHRKVGMAEIEQTWPTHPESTKRLLHHRSWVETCRWKEISDDDVARLLQRLDAAGPEEVGEGFTFIRFLLNLGKTPPASIDLMIKWLRSHVTAKAPPMWIFTACMAARVAIKDGAPIWKSEHLEALLQLVLDCQPIPEGHAGTWAEIDQLIIALFKDSTADTTEFLARLFDSNPGGLRKLFDHTSRSRSCFMEMTRWSGLPKLLMEMFSVSTNRRQLAISLINSGMPLNLVQSELAALNESRIALGILQARLDGLRPQAASGLLLQLLPRIENGSEELKSLFAEELSYQAKNLPGLCLEAFKKSEKSSPVLKAAIAEAESYLESLRAASASPVSAMCIPGLRRARVTTQRRRSLEITKTTKEASVFLQLVKSFHIIYGNEGFASYLHGTLSPPTPFQEFSKSAEMPRLDLMDRDGQVLRRHHIVLQIRSLEKRCASPNSNDA